MKKNTLAFVIGVVVLGLVVLGVKASNPVVYAGLEQLFKATVWVMFYGVPVLLALIYNYVLAKNTLGLSGIVVVFLWIVGLMVYVYALPVIGMSLDNAMGTTLFKGEKSPEFGLALIGAVTYLITWILTLFGPDL